MMISTIKNWLHKITSPKCKHLNFKVRATFGPTTGRHKIWHSCQCDDCRQWFVYEETSGERFLTDGPGFGFQKI